ncbi:MAG: dihydrolipoamide acetyltransferase family protein, partial [Anaerolineae bacterium]
MSARVYMPQLGLTMSEGTIVEWLKADGDSVEKGEPILVIETDKVTADVEAPASGALRGLRAEPGSVVAVGEVLAFVLEKGEELPADAGGEHAEVSAVTPGISPPESEQQPMDRKGRVFASPIARKVAQEEGIDLALVEGTGPRGRVTERDVRAYVDSAPLPVPEPADAGPPPSEPTADDVEWVDLSTVRRVTAERMAFSKSAIPHFTLSVEVDMSEAARLRRQLMHWVLSQTGSRLSYTALLVKVVALAIRRHPMVNAEFMEHSIKVHKEVNLGVAVGTADGLFVPVIRQADSKDFLEIVRELACFREKAEAMDFAPD